jgi:hypothetical protein
MTALEVFAAMRVVAAISVMPIEVVVHMTPEISTPMEPGACSDKDTAREPLGAIVTIGRALVGRVIEISVRAFRRWADLHGNLSVQFVR